MEKIYMENNNDNKNSFYFKDFFRRNGIVITSVLIIVVAIAAFITSSFNQTSYAIPDVTNALPDTFKTANVDITKLLRGQSATGLTGGDVQPYYTDGGIQVFCLENNIAFTGDVQYAKGKSIGDTDYGLLYLMANSYPNKNNSNLDEELQTWITQIAIWDYLYQTGDENNTNYGDMINKVKDVVCVRDESKYYWPGGSADAMKGSCGGTESIYTKYVTPLVNAAKANKGGVNKSLKAKTETNEISLTEDEKYYQSSAVIVTGAPSDNFNGFEVKFAAKPDGTILVNSKGEEIKDLSNFKPGDKFWVRVPVDKVKEDNKVVKLSITGSFSVYDGNYYVADGAQTISAVETVNSNVNTGLDIELNYTPDVPDTGMSTAQTIYFVGLIVLLSGLGIIYANVKPKESN